MKKKKMYDLYYMVPDNRFRIGFRIEQKFVYRPLKELQKFLKEMDDLGLPKKGKYIIDDSPEDE